MTPEERAKAALNAAFKETDNLFDERIILKHFAAALAEVEQAHQTAVDAYKDMVRLRQLAQAEAAALRAALASWLASSVEGLREILGGICHNDKIYVENKIAALERGKE